MTQRNRCNPVSIGEDVINALSMIVVSTTPYAMLGEGPQSWTEHAYSILHIGDGRRVGSILKAKD